MTAQQARTRKKTAPADGTLGLTIFETLRAEIASGTIEPGEPLSRRALASRFGCSYSTIVEVMVRLESTELIEVESSQIARVVRPSLERIRDAHVLIEAYEAQAIRLACQSATQTDLDDLYAAAEALEARIARRDVGDGKVAALHAQFHKRIAQAGRAPALIRAMERSQLLIRCHRHAIVTAKDLPDPPRWHAVLVDTIAARDPVAADAAMRTHMQRGLEKDLLAYQLASVQ